MEKWVKSEDFFKEIPTLFGTLFVKQNMSCSFKPFQHHWKFQQKTKHEPSQAKIKERFLIKTLTRIKKLNSSHVKKN